MFFFITLVLYGVKTAEIRNDYENWLRLVVLVNSAGKSLCDEILHKKEQLPLNGAQLYSILERHKNKMHYQIHKEILCPSNKIIDESKFDLMIYAAVIHLMFGAKYKELIYDVRDMRNKIFHMKDVSICTTNFKQLWNKAYAMLRKHGFDVELFNVLRTSDLFSVEEYKGILQFLSF